MKSGRCCCDVRSRSCDRPFLLAVAGGRRRRVWYGWPPLARQRGHVWKGETVRSCHPLSASLWAYSQRWREGGSGRAWWMVQKPHLFTAIVTRVVIFCWSLLIPEKKTVCGIVCGRRQCRHIHWCAAGRRHTLWLTQTVFPVQVYVWFIISLAYWQWWHLHIFFTNIIV